MKQHKLMGALALTGAFALALSGCATDTNGGGDKGGDGDTSSTETKAADYNPQPRENLKQGGTVNFVDNEIPAQLNPFNSDASAPTARLAAWYTPQLLLMEPDGTPYKNDNYLDKWDFEVVDGKTVLTFVFTEEATWNDGTPMDWTAIENTWKTNRSNDEGYNPNATDGYKEIEKVEKGDTDKTAIVTFKNEFAWPQMLFTGLVHPKVNTPDLFNESFIDNPHSELGAGPYVVDKFDANSDFISFKPNEKWWGDKPLLDEVTFRGMDAQASINAFKNGEIDMVGVGNKDRLAQVSDMKDITIYRAQQTANSLLQVDAKKPQFEDINVRKAFFLSVDIEQQKKIAWNGLDYTEDPAGSFILYSFQPHYVDSFKEAGWSHNVDEAKKLLDEAGWTEGADGIREKDGVKLSVTYPIFSDDATQKALAQSLQASAKEAGFELKIDVRPSTKFGEDYVGKNWDVVSLRFTSSDSFGAAWFCQMYCMDQGLNLSETSTPEIDEKIHTQLETISDPEQQTIKAMELEAEIMAETWGIAPLYNGPSISAVKNGLANLTPEPYVGLDLFGVQPVENVGWEKDD